MPTKATLRQLGSNIMLGMQFLARRRIQLLVLGRSLEKSSARFGREFAVRTLRVWVFRGLGKIVPVLGGNLNY
jgi:hypothetical protein